MESELIIAYIILFFSFVALLVCYLIHRLFVNSHEEQLAEGVPPPPPPPTTWPWELTWLAWLTAATIALLIVQIVLGVLTHTLLLLADSAHGAADAATYVLAAFVEYTKYSFGRRSVSRKVRDYIDQASALFSVSVVVVTSVAVAVEASLRMWRRDGKEDIESLGTAVLVVACLGACLNLSLLWVHSKMSSNGHVEDATQGRGGRRRREETDNHGTGSLKLSLHAVLHPGCGSCTSTSSDTQAAQGQNFNVYGVLLHVCTDVVRTLLLVVVGVLVRCGVLKDADRVDAISSIIICGCVTLGSVWLFRAAFAGLGRSSLACVGESQLPTASHGATSES